MVSNVVSRHRRGTPEHRDSGRNAPQGRLDPCALRDGGCDTSRAPRARWRSDAPWPGLRWPPPWRVPHGLWRCGFRWIPRSKLQSGLLNTLKAWLSYPHPGTEQLSPNGRRCNGLVHCTVLLGGVNNHEHMQPQHRRARSQVSAVLQSLEDPHQAGQNQCSTSTNTLLGSSEVVASLFAKAIQISRTFDVDNPG